MSWSSCSKPWQAIVFKRHPFFLSSPIKPNKKSKAKNILAPPSSGSVWHPFFNFADCRQLCSRSCVFSRSLIHMYVCVFVILSEGLHRLNNREVFNVCRTTMPNQTITTRTDKCFVASLPMKDYACHFVWAKAWNICLQVNNVNFQ